MAREPSPVEGNQRVDYRFTDFGLIEDENAMAMTEEIKRGTNAERVVVPQGGTSTVGRDDDAVTLRALADGTLQVCFDGPIGCVLLRIDEAVELYDGDLLCAGRLWMSFRAGRSGRPGRLQLLDDDGCATFGIALRGTTLSLGREVGDVVLPWDDSLAELHLQVLVRHDGTFVQDLASPGGTWIVVQPGEVLPSGSAVVIGERLFRVSTPPVRRIRALERQPRSCARAS
jgi:hypothetical protein